MNGWTYDNMSSHDARLTLPSRPARVHSSLTCSPPKKHGSMMSCWLEIDGYVYDVSDFLYEHPGGEEILIETAGKPGAGRDFRSVSHSSVAKDMLKKYKIGKFAK